MSYPFQYRQVSRAFIQDLFHEVRSGQSVVLLGQRFGGKRHVIKRLRLLLQEARVRPVVNLRLLSGTPITTTEEAEQTIREATRRAAEGLGFELSGGGHLLAPLERLADRLGQPVFLLAANVDGMAHHLARSFLRSVRILCERQKVVAVMSGEEDFHDLVHGDNSEFTCANQFVLQGYDEEEFYGFIRRYLNQLTLRFKPEGEVFRHIWRITGGNIYLLRIILWALVQTRTRGDAPPDAPVGVGDVPVDLKLNGIPGAYGAHVFRHATQLIDREHDVWETLEQMLRASRDGSPAPVVRQNPPTILELSGVAVRESEGGVSRLAFASPLMGAFITQYYDHRRLGDLYGSVRRWDKAVEHYKELPPEGRLRPSGADDRGSTEIMVSALVSTLHSEATRINQSENPVHIIKSLEKIFALGCRYLLGFREVTFWDQDAAQQWTGWVYRQPDDPAPPEGDRHAPPARVLREIQSHLPTDSSLTPGIYPMREEGNRYGLLAVLPGLLRDERAAVVVSDFEQRRVVWRERARLIDQMLKEFVAVYTHAVSVYNRRRRGRLNRQYIEIINDIFHQLGSPQLSVRALIENVARELRERVEYKRVVFSLVDPERRLVEGFLDDSDDDAGKIHHRICWRLDDPTADVQPYVINKRDFLIITDIATEPYIDRKTMKAAGIKSAAVVPLINPNNVAIGTILVERRNGVPPSHDEANDLKEFGRQLAIAIEQCERVNMLEACLNQIPEPLLIVDRTENVRYQNLPAAALFDRRPGWFKAHESNPLTSREAGKIVELIRRSLETGHRTADFVRGVGVDPKYEGEVVADSIADWRGNGKVAGGLLRIQDRTYLNKYFEADRMVAAADDVEDAIRRMLQAMETLGHQWGWLYRVRRMEDGDEELYSELCFGQPEGGPAEGFNRGEVVLAPRSRRGHKDWLCIENNSPVVFCYLADEKEDAVYVTPHGLRATNWPDPQPPERVRRNPGDFWLDFPLVIDTDKALGKVCLQCSETLKPEHFELLKHLSGAFSEILGAAIQRKFNKEEEERTIKVTLARKTMGTMAHNIGTRHGSLPALLASYRRREKKLPELAAMNDRFAYIVDHIMATIMRAKELLSPVTVRLAPVDLVGQIRRSLEHALPEGAFQLDAGGAGEPVVVPLDAHRFDMALLELVQNSYEAAGALESLRIKITVGERREDGRRFVSVIYEDNGPGVSPDAQPYIFVDYFSQRPDGDTAGIGLGMGYVLRVVEGHGGRIEYAGRWGEGAKFLITLPAGDAEEPRGRTDV